MDKGAVFDLCENIETSSPALLLVVSDPSIVRYRRKGTRALVVAAHFILVPGSTCVSPSISTALSAGALRTSENI